MCIILYLDESELSLVFKSLRYLGSYEPSSELTDLHLRLRLLHGDLDMDLDEDEDEDDSTVLEDFEEEEVTTEQREDEDLSL